MNIKRALLAPGVVAVLLAATPVIPAFTNAAVAGPQRGERGERVMQRLNLTEAQKTQMKQIREATRAQMDTVLTDAQKSELAAAKQERRRPNLSLTEAQKTRMKEIREQARQRMEAILTPEQRAQLEQMKQQRQQRRSNPNNSQPGI